MGVRGFGVTGRFNSGTKEIGSGLMVVSVSISVVGSGVEGILISTSVGDRS